MNINLVDYNNKPIEVGDIVLRSMYSGITFHRIVKINRKSVKLTCGSVERNLGSSRIYLSRNFAKTVAEVDNIECVNRAPVTVYIWGGLSKAHSLFKIEEK